MNGLGKAGLAAADFPLHVDDLVLGAVLGDVLGDEREKLIGGVAGIEALGGVEVSGVHLLCSVSMIGGCA